MTAEQKERARQLKRIADALELMAGMVPMSKLVKMVDEGKFDRSYIIKEDLKK